MTAVQNWRARAFNQATDSHNQIHSDEMAKAYGFEGALVPGVTISSYLMHPAVEAWGEAWLTKGFAKVVVSKPLYDGYEFEVNVSEITATSYQAILVDERGTQCATAFVRLNEDQPTPPQRRGDALRTDTGRAPAVSQAHMRALQAEGTQALIVQWHAEDNLATYLKDRASMPRLLRFDGAGFANGAFMLGLTNTALAGNTYMNPWVHVQTESQFFGPVSDGETLVLECAVEDLFEKKGHQFVDLRVDAYRQSDDQAVMSALLRAIYILRPPT